MFSQTSHLAAQVAHVERLLRLGQHDEAIASAQQAASGAADNADLLNSLGLALIHAGRFAEAEQSLAAALRLDLKHALAWCNLGNALAGQQRHADATVALSMAIDLAPNFVDALNSRAFAWSALKDYVKAKADFQAVLAQRPSDARAAAVLAIMRAHLCEWEGRDEALTRMRSTVADDGPVVLEAFEALAFYDDPSLHRRVATLVARQAAAGAQPLPPPAAARSGKIRIGYVSADFRDHVISYIMAEVLERHDRQRFEIIGLSIGPTTDDAFQQRIAAACDEFHRLPHASPAKVARAIRSCDIEIAVDLTGYTQWGKPAAFAWRPAPVQASFLGYPGTLGLADVDHIIADRVVIPTGADEHYAEAVVRLPHAYHPCHPLPPSAPTSRQAHGLPSDAPVFCCFNNPYKITPAVFAVWIEILKAVPGSVLWLLSGHAQAADNLRREARAAGVEPQRLVFAPRLDPAAHASRVALADVVLDTAPYGAHTTAFDALWAGVPVVTCPGKSFASRVAASLLTAADAPQLICDSWEAYRAKATELAIDPALAASLRQRLKTARASAAPLFDTQRFTKDLERAFEAMAARSRQGLPPQAIDLEPVP